MNTYCLVMWKVTVQNGYELKKIVYMNLLTVNATSHFTFLDVPVDFTFLTFMSTTSETYYKYIYIFKFTWGLSVTLKGIAHNK